MQIGVPKETQSGETRIAASPETVKKLIAQKHELYIESGAGITSSSPDESYAALGAKIVDAASAWACPMVLTVRAPTASQLQLMQEESVLIGMLNPFDKEGLDLYNNKRLSAFALEAAPRISRAQSLDVLSSQANVAGYKAVLLAASAYQRLFPMLMTAAGTVKAARVVVLGAGVAGLQAIATAKRLGAVVEASDVRPAVKEQIESLGAKFIDVPFVSDEEKEIAKGVGGYARPMPAEWLARQSALVAERIKQADIVITTALIPGRAAPKLVSSAMVESMRPGSVIVDMAAAQGGNCELTQPGQTVTVKGVHIIGETNIPALVAADASALYARNILDFLKLVFDKDGQFYLNLEDEIIATTLMCHAGSIRHTS